MIDDHGTSVWVIKNEFFGIFLLFEKSPKYGLWIWPLVIDLKSKWHIYRGPKQSVVVLISLPIFALGAVRRAPLYSALALFSRGNRGALYEQRFVQRSYSAHENCIRPDAFKSHFLHQVWWALFEQRFVERFEQRPMQSLNSKNVHEEAMGNARCNQPNMQEEMLMSIKAHIKDTQHTRIKHMHELWVCATISSRQVST